MILKSRLSKLNRGFIRWENRHRLIPHIIVFFILTFLTAKVLFRSNSSNSIFFLYGIAVTTIISITFTYAFVFYKDPYHKAKKKVAGKDLPLVSCLVAVYNEVNIIERCVASIASQTYKNKEVIFVNDCSTDGTGQILDDLAEKYPIKVIHLSKNIGKKGALVEGIRNSKGTIYAFSDSDSTWATDAIEKIVPIFLLYPSVGAVSGHTRALNGSDNLLTKIQDSWYEGQYSIRKAFESAFGTITCVSGPLAAFRKEAIYNFLPAWEHDKFMGQDFRFATDRTLTGFVLGSESIGTKIKSKWSDSPFLNPDYPLRDWKLVYCKAAKAWTQVPDSMGSVLKQQIRWKKSFIRNMFFTGSFYWRKPFIPALVYYMHVLFVIIGPLIAFRHIIYLPLHGNIYSMFLYIGGIVFIGFLFGLAYKLEDPESKLWIYRPLMSLMSTLMLSWLIYYSLFTIRKMVWYRA